jgi:hypothetical protein
MWMDYNQFNLWVVTRGIPQLFIIKKNKFNFQRRRVSLDQFNINVKKHLKDTTIDTHIFFSLTGGK